MQRLTKYGRQTDRQTSSNHKPELLCNLVIKCPPFTHLSTRSGSVLTGLISPVATNSSFSKNRSRSRPLGQIYWYQQKGLATRNTHMKYERPISFGSKVMAKVNFFSKVGQMVKVKFTLDRRTDRVIPIYPPPQTSFAGGIMMY